MIKAVLFDLDGTITDTETINAFVMGNVIDSLLNDEQQKQLNLDTQKRREQFYFTNFAGKRDWGETFVNLLGTTTDIKSMWAIFESERTKYLQANGIAIKPGFSELVAFLQKNKIKIALGTSSRREMVEEKMKTAKLSPEIFDVIACAEDYPNGKPAPDCWNHLRQKLNLDNAECLIIEDSHAGALSGIASKIPTVVIRDVSALPDGIIPQLKKYIHNGALSDIIEIIKQENNI